MKPTRPIWAIPAPVAGLAAGIGIIAGIWGWSQGFPLRAQYSELQRVERMDLFGNAPLDSLAGSYLMLNSKRG